ncbi:MAG: GNAT family N-acetyltransferase [Myxococcota bacterium]
MNNGWSPPTITTDRLVIRPMSVGDLVAVNGFTTAYPASRYGNWLGDTDPASVARYIADTVARYGRPPRCDLGVIVDHQLIGGIAFRQVWLSPPAMELGWVLHPKLAGQGLASEALKAILEYLTLAFPDLGRFEARVHSADERSQRVLERLGFQAEGTLRGGLDMNGEVADSVMFGMLRDEFSP